MRILYHHRTLGDGAEGVHIASMVEAFCALGHEVRVAALIGAQTNVATPSTWLLSHLIASMPRPVYELLELAYSVVGYGSLRREIAKWRPDLVYERYTLFNFAGLWASRSTHLPFVLEMNAPLAFERQAYERLSLQRLARFCERRIASRADITLLVSTPLRDYLGRIGADISRSVVLPNGVDPRLFRPNHAARAAVRQRYNLQPTDVVIGFVGILRPWHGLDVLLRAFSVLAKGAKDVRLLIVGDGPSRESIESLARDLSIAPYVTITGRVPHANVPEYVAAMDIGVSAKTTFYASPMKVPEYMACRVAVVAPNTPNVRDLVEHASTGLLFNEDDHHSLAACLERLVADPVLLERIRSAALADVQARRTWLHNASLVLEAVTPSKAQSPLPR